MFFLKLGLSFVVGSTWVTLGTVLAERYGSKVGGMVAGLPTTILLGLFFIGWTQSTETAVMATTIVPVIGAINCLFLVTYLSLLKVGFRLALAGSILLWFILSLTVTALGFSNFPLALLAYVVLFLLSYNFAERKLDVESQSGRSITYTPLLILLRGLFSGFIIVLTVVLTWVGGPLLGGTFAMFPAMFLGTLAITYFHHGPAFSSAVMKSSILGAVSVVLFGVAVRYTYPHLGLWWGTAVSTAISYAAAVAIYGYSRKKMR